MPIPASGATIVPVSQPVMLEAARRRSRPRDRDDVGW